MRSVKYLIHTAALLFIIAAALSVSVQAGAFDVYAGGPGRSIGSLSGKQYTDLDEMFDDLKDDYEGKSVTIEMSCDWSEDRDKWNDERMVIPKNCRAVFNMNGYMFNRWLSWYNDWEANGENICVESGASLIINGGETRPHRVGVYTGLDSGNKANTYKVIKGGVIAGGCSANGAGGIHVKDNASLTLNGVTIAGCRAECPWYDSAGTNSGYGGGIWIKGGGSNVKLSDSCITGCHAQLDGGGIFGSNHNNMRVELERSHVDGNYSRSDGGGIDLDGEYLILKGSEGSTVSNNKTNGVGGGVYIWNDNVSVIGLRVQGNSAKQGGGIYTLEEDVALKNLELLYNHASDKGGGIYIANDKNSINGCTVIGNSKYGVYAESDVDADFSIQGKTVIKDNSGGNLTLEDGDSYLKFSLAVDSEVHMGYVNKPSDKDKNWYRVSPEDAGYGTYKSANCIRFLRADNAGYHFNFNQSPESRKIYYVKDGYDKQKSVIGEPVTDSIKPESVTVSNASNEAVPAEAGSVKAGGDRDAGGEFKLIRGYLHHEKTASGSMDTDQIFYYSDGLFFGDPAAYNDHLATASWALAFGGTYLREGEADAASYKYKHAGARQFLADIGCPDDMIYVNDSNISKPGTDSIGVIIGSKQLKYADGQDAGAVLIPVAVRGGGYEAEWASNVLLGSGTETSRDGEALGFSQAADQVISSIEYYISKYGLEDEIADGKVRFWVSGFSRAGATANLTSKRLIEKYCFGEKNAATGNQVFAYPCEAPKGGTDSAQKLPKEAYYCIHNMINPTDVVPLVGPSEMGFKRYGVDHYIPGTAAGSVTEAKTTVSRGGSSGITEVTTYRDNTYLRSKGEKNIEDNTEYVYRRSRMLKHLAAIDVCRAWRSSSG